jgi:hypothetical protein
MAGRKAIARAGRTSKGATCAREVLGMTAQLLEIRGDYWLRLTVDGQSITLPVTGDQVESLRQLGIGTASIHVV